MLLAWFKNTNIYIGQRIVMLQVGSTPPRVFEYAATLPIERVLKKIDGLVQKGSKLKVFLSGSLCTPLATNIPTGVQSFDEIHKLTIAHAVHVMGGSANQYVVEIDKQDQSLAGVVSVSVLETLERWIKIQGSSIVSVSPIWAVVSQMKAVPSSKAKGFILQEPDGRTLVLKKHGENLHAIHWGSEFSPSEIEDQLPRTFAECGINKEDLLHIKFSEILSSPLTKPSKCFPHNWSIS